MAEVALVRVSKAFADTPVLTDLSLQIADGEFCVVLGPSGCGKSTLLRLVAGLEEVDSGSIFLGGRDVTAATPQERNVGMVFQNYALYPHMTVAENIGLPLLLRKVGRDRIAGRVREVAAMLGLEKELGRRPRQLSGGQRQRVALGRAIAFQPQAYLFDEPLSNVDALLRVRMRAEIARLWQSLGATVVYVTHDQTEALALGSRICVLFDGQVQQVGDADTIYARPCNRFVAGFVGTPPINFVSGRLHFTDNLYFEPWEMPVALSDAVRLRPRHNQEIVLGVRPENLQTADEPGPPFALKGTVERVEFLGSVTWVHCTVMGQALVARRTDDRAYRVGQTLHVTVNTAHLHWFDPVTGDRV